MHLRKMDIKLLLLVVLSSGVQYTVCMSTTILAASSSSPEATTTSSPQASDSSSSNMSTTVLPDSSAASDVTSNSSNVTEQRTVATGSPSNQSFITQTESPMDARRTKTSVFEGSSTSSSNQSLPTQTESPTESSNTTDSPTTPISDSSSVNPNTSGTASSRQTAVTTSPIVTSNAVVEEVTSSPNNSDTTTSVEFPNGTIMNANTSLEDVTNSTNISETTTTFRNVNVLDSAFFVCGVHVFQNASINAGFLFPPSDNNMPNISSITDAEQMFNSSYESFCGELVPFTHCVKETLKNDASETDNILKLYIDMDNLDTALDVYCNNNDSIPSQLQCTVSAVESNSCPYGGIMGVSKYVMNAIQTGMPKDQYCAGLKESIRCRVDKQLKNCGTSYAETMDIVYTALTGKYCK